MEPSFCFPLLLAVWFISQCTEALPQVDRKGALVTCPGFPGYCSQAYPGDTCTVVCAFGRNNVPLCRSDGNWSDVPRCIDHEPGKPEQLTGICPGIPGYCSDSNIGTLCEFDCLTGADIRSLCGLDGTWNPYPVCEGDVRETRDGCDGCPGPFGKVRSRKEGTVPSNRDATTGSKAKVSRDSAINGGVRSAGGSETEDTRNVIIPRRTLGSDLALGGSGSRANKAENRTDRNHQSTGSPSTSTKLDNRSGCSQQTLELCIGGCPSKAFQLCATGCVKRC